MHIHIQHGMELSCTNGRKILLIIGYIVYIQFSIPMHINTCMFRYSVCTCMYTFQQLFRINIKKESSGKKFYQFAEYVYM